MILFSLKAFSKYKVFYEKDRNNRKNEYKFNIIQYFSIKIHKNERKAENLLTIKPFCGIMSTSKTNLERIFIMKKVITLALCAIMLVGAMLFSLTSCSGDIKVGVQSATTGYDYVSELEGYEPAAYDNLGLAIKDLAAGNVKYVIGDEAPVKAIAAKTEGVKVINVPLTTEEYAFGVDKEQDELLASINNILATEKTAIDAIFAAYATGEGINPVTSATKDLSKSDKQLVIATNAAFAPFEYKDGDKFAGIDIEIMKLVADKLNMELVIEDMDFDSVVTSVGKNGVDVAAAGLTVNEERKQSINFSTSYYNAAQVVCVLESDTSFDSCKTADDVLAVFTKK